MYNGIKRKPFKFNFKLPSKAQLIGIEEVETNGIIRQNYVVKTITYFTDPNIDYRDFEIANLMAAGVNVNTLQTTMMTPSIEKMASNVETANILCDQYEIIKEIENETATTTTPQEQLQQVQ